MDSTSSGVRNLAKLAIPCDFFAPSSTTDLKFSGEVIIGEVFRSSGTNLPTILRSPVQSAPGPNFLLMRRWLHDCQTGNKRSCRS